MAVKSLDNWSGAQALDTSGSMNDPLVEQINIIKGYLKQARDALRFEEVDFFGKYSVFLFKFLPSAIEIFLFLKYQMYFSG